MKQYKGAIFDLDGTLLDSMWVWDDIDVAFLKKRGLEVPPDYQEAITPLGFLEAARYTIRRFGFPETPEELIQEWHQMAVDAYTYEVKRRGSRISPLFKRKRNPHGGCYLIEPGAV